MAQPDPETLALIRFLIPIVKPLRDSNPDEWPEGFCAECSALVDESICALMKGVKAQCGAIPNPCHRSGKTNHVWSRLNGMNIDFTAHQFPSLAKHTVKVDGFDVIFGDDAKLKSLGYIFYPPEQCKEALMHAGMENLMNGLKD